jgi:hypothetical protein
MSPLNPLTMVSLMLTLAGLLGSFFYIQLSQWLRDLMALEKKSDLNRFAGSEAEKRALLECRVEYRKLVSWPTTVVNLSVILFVLFVLGNALLMIRTATADPLYPNIAVALWVFLGLFVVLSFGLLGLGRRSAVATRGILDKAAPKAG